MAPMARSASSIPSTPAADIAYAVVFLASEQAAWISGQILSVDGGRS